MPSSLYDSARVLIARLERLSADSIWAHRASGLRGSLYRALEGGAGENQLSGLIRRGYEILEKAAAVQLSGRLRLKK